MPAHKKALNKRLSKVIKVKITLNKRQIPYKKFIIRKKAAKKKRGVKNLMGKKIIYLKKCA